MDDVHTKYDGLICGRNKHELSMLRDEIDMALIRIDSENTESGVNYSRGEGKRH